MVKQIWLPPIACTVIGASHQRKGRPCQDASLSRSFISKNGEQLHLLVVADGHGGERYWLSDVGSRLACEEAANAIEAAVTKNCLDDQHHWHHLLADELPSAIHTEWLLAIHQDWQNQQNRNQQDFSPQLYGCTLGLALMAPQWWGHAGLGDWDLVAIKDGKAELVSEEKDLNAAGEATASLSMADAIQQFRPRFNLLPLEPTQDGLHLILSTDGIRKSCPTDEDFCALCVHLANLSKAEDVGQALREITSQGSGDDVSVAIGRIKSSTSHSLGLSNRYLKEFIFTNQFRCAIRCIAIFVATALVAAAFFALKSYSEKILTRPPSQETNKLQAIETTASLLCASPIFITQALGQKQQLFDQLIGDKAMPITQSLIYQSGQDRIAELIAYSVRQAWLEENQDLSALDVINSCPRLMNALEQVWLMHLVKQTNKTLLP